MSAAAWAYDNLTWTIMHLSRPKILSFTLQASARYDQIRQFELGNGKDDLRIAATALEHGATLVTRSASDFGRVPGLALENWSV